ncbi:MAG: hypothetical protein QHC90_07910 [Shinella sp.]|nr:hypothetical protein [Shinella sp.]
MTPQTRNFQLHFDFLSRKALLCCGGKDYVLPDSYPNKEAAEAAAQKFAWETLGLRMQGDGETPDDINIWTR